MRGALCCGGTRLPCHICRRRSTVLPSCSSSDPHIDAAPDYAGVLIEAIRGLDYDVCVLTGDYRARTFGPFDAALAGLATLRPHLKGTPYAILGNHDPLRMVPGMEAMGYRVLLNEWTAIRRDGAAIYFAGIDDAHFYRMDNFHRAADEIPAHAVSICCRIRPRLIVTRRMPVSI